MSQTHKDLVREFYAAIDGGHMDRVRELCAPDATFQFGGAPAVSTDVFLSMLSGAGSGASTHVVRDLVAEGTHVACHVDVVNSSDGGVSTTKALTLFTMVDGKIGSELVLIDRGLPG